MSLDTAQAPRVETLVDKRDTVHGTAVSGDKLYSPGVWRQVTEFLNVFCRYLVKRKVVAGNADVGKELAGQVAIRHWKATAFLLRVPTHLEDSCQEGVRISLFIHLPETTWECQCDEIIDEVTEIERNFIVCFF